MQKEHIFLDTIKPHPYSQTSRAALKKAAPVPGPFQYPTLPKKCTVTSTVVRSELTWVENKVPNPLKPEGVNWDTPSQECETLSNQIPG